MAELTTIAAAILGVGLGAFAIAYPEALVRVHAAGRGPPGRHGEYGSSDVPDRWRRIARWAGVLVLLVGLYFGYVALTA